MTDILSALIELEKGFWQAAGDDGSYYRRYFADDGVMILPFEGGMLQKDQIIQTVQQSARWDDFSIISPRLLELSAGLVALVYEAAGRRSGQADYRAYVSSIYRKHGENWQLVLHQQTPLS